MKRINETLVNSDNKLIMFDRSGARIFYGVPLLREREWELKKKKKKKSLPLGFLRSNVDTLVNQNVSHSTTAAFLNPLERRGEKSRFICWTAAARSSPYKNGWVQENSRLPEHKAIYFVGIWWSTFCCDRYQENFFFFFMRSLKVTCYYKFTHAQKFDRCTRPRL